MKTKICSQCPDRGPQPLSNFSLRNGKPRSYCKSCKRSWNNADYIKNRAEHRKRLKTRRAVLQDWLREFKTTVKCNRCPESHPATIQFHHCDPTIKEINLASAALSGWSIDRIKAEIAKCEIICANCHAKEHWLQKRSLIRNRT